MHALHLQQLIYADMNSLQHLNAFLDVIRQLRDPTKYHRALEI